MSAESYQRQFSLKEKLAGFLDSNCVKYYWFLPKSCRVSLNLTPLRVSRSSEGFFQHLSNLKHRRVNFCSMITRGVPKNQKESLPCASSNTFGARTRSAAGTTTFYEDVPVLVKGKVLSITPTQLGSIRHKHNDKWQYLSRMKNY